MKELHKTVPNVKLKKVDHKKFLKIANVWRDSMKIKPLLNVNLVMVKIVEFVKKMGYVLNV